MNDDSAEWMAQLKASGQLRPDPQEERGGDDNGQRVEARRLQQRLGLVVASGNQRGRQVLGTCSPGRFKALIWRLLTPRYPQLTDEQQQSVDEQVRLRSEWIRTHSRREQP